VIKQQFGFKNNPAVWTAQEPLQDQCAGSADESVPGPSIFAWKSMTRGLVCKEKGLIKGSRQSCKAKTYPNNQRVEIISSEMSISMG
jgi:hypothetical protein